MMEVKWDDGKAETGGYGKREKDDRALSNVDNLSFFQSNESSTSATFYCDQDNWQPLDKIFFDVSCLQKNAYTIDTG